MDEVMDCVVETQLKIYNTICYRVWKLCFLGNRQRSLQVSIRVSGWQSGSRTLVRGLKTTWSGKLSDSYTTAVYIYFKTGRRNCRC